MHILNAVIRRTLGENSLCIANAKRFKENGTGRGRGIGNFSDRKGRPTK